MEDFRFQTRFNEESHRLAEAAEVIIFDKSKRNLVLGFDLRQDKLGKTYADLEMHIYRGCQNLWFRDTDGTTYSIVAEPTIRINTETLVEVRYMVHACVED